SMSFHRYKLIGVTKVNIFANVFNERAATCTVARTFMTAVVQRHYHAGSIVYFFQVEDCRACRSSPGDCTVTVVRLPSKRKLVFNKYIFKTISGKVSDTPGKILVQLPLPVISIGLP